MFNGKSDLLQSYSKKQLIPNFSESERLILDKVMIGDKTSGWVSEYLDEFFKISAQIDGELSIKTFQKYLENEDNRESILKAFKYNFLELHALIGKICDIIC